MKVKLLVALLLLSTLPAFAQAPTKIVFNWGYPGTPIVPICTATITTLCVNTFVLTQGTQSFTQTITAVAGTTSYSFVQTPLPPPGTYTYTLIANETTAGGNIPSVPVTVFLQVPQAPTPPTTFTGVVQ